MFSTPPTPAMSIPLTSIRATLERHLALTEGYLPAHIPSNVPLFDTTLPPSTTSKSIGDYASHISSFGLPASLASDVIKLIAQESEQYRAFIEQMRMRQLRELSTTSVSSDPSSIPALVEAACNTFHGLLIRSGIEEIQQLSATHESVGSDVEEQSNSEDDSDAFSDSQEGDEAGEETFDDGEEDDNAPIKPGEDIPPLDTKYLPIFDALHERGKVLTKPEKTYLVNMTGMTYRQITIWFQNRRRGELKESSNLANAYSKASSTHSGESSEFSDNELEKNLGTLPTSAAFDIRSWRMTSAFPTKDGVQVSSIPPSPTKIYFGTPAMATDSDTEDSDLSDSDDDAPVPPGLRVPSLSSSMSTTATTTSAISAQNAPSTGPHATTSIAASSTERPISARPIRPLPAARMKTPPTTVQPAQVQRLPVFDNGAAGPGFTPTSFTPLPSQHSVTSNERGLTVQINTIPQGSVATLPSPPANHSTTSPSTSPSSPNPAASPQRNTSPTPSAHSGLSPRPPVKPLPRRTGCAPRPRPPPRASPPSGVALISAPSSTRASVVLPPSSNPSLGGTTLGSLLRPNQPAPRISPEMEERLTAMAGRMGVGTGANLNLTQANSRQITVAAPTVPRPGFTLPSFGPTSLPRPSMLAGTISSPASGRSPQTSAGPSHP
ncbi:hypothetical protein FRC11_004261 [Ceratobasidium sp. 423]|nr:hypothetical protein FRC11_004261 [Ceratobasidium sp. 423]